VIRAVYAAALALWVGGLATISFVVAPAAFQQDRPAAGKIVGAALRRFGGVEIGCGLVALAASLRLRRGGRWERTLRPVAGTVMLALTLTYVLWVYPAAAAARDLPERFALLHRISVLLVSANILVGALQLVVSAARVKPPDAA